MAVYVDPLFQWGGSRKFRWTHSCHMYADTREELHTFAAFIGMARTWFQEDARLPHYDLNPARRASAVELGAIEHTRRQMVEFMHNQHITGMDEVLELAARDLPDGYQIVIEVEHGSCAARMFGPKGEETDLYDYDANRRSVCREVLSGIKTAIEQNSLLGNPPAPVLTLEEISHEQ